MRVSSSNLGLRFYKSDGWSKELLDVIGTFMPHPQFDVDETTGFGGYWIPIGEVDIDKLMGIVTNVSRAFDDCPKESDREFVERMLKQ
jgi:hypothetical protein